MELNLLKEKLRGLIGEAQVVQALDVLIEWLDTHGLHSEHDDIVLLKLNFKKAQYQCEVQGTLPRSEFELVQNRTVSAMQAVARRLEEKPEKIRLTEGSRRGKSKLWAVIGVFAVLVVAGVGYWVSGKPRPINQHSEEDQVDSTQAAIEDTTSKIVVKTIPKAVQEPPVSPPEDPNKAAREKQEAEKDANFREALQKADGAFDRNDPALALVYYLKANQLKITTHVSDRIAICQSFKQHGRGTYIVKAVREGDKIPANSMRFFKGETGRGDDLTNINDYPNGFKAKKYLKVGTYINWKEKDIENDVESIE